MERGTGADFPNWSKDSIYASGHVTLVVDDNVYGFKPKRPGNKGFVKTSTSDWVNTHLDGWTLRKLPSKPPLANG